MANSKIITAVEAGVKTIVDIGDKVASSLFKQTAKEFIDGAKNQIHGFDIMASKQAQGKAIKFMSNLIQFCLYQDINNEYSLEAYNWINEFDDQQIVAGNSKQFVKNLLTGVEMFAPEAFIPATLTLPAAEASVISMYNADGTLAPGAYQFKKPLTIQAPVWIPYFISGKLQQYIGGIVSNMRQTYKLYKLFLYQGILTTEANFNKIIKGTATNMFDCFANEIIPEINRMKFLTNEFNLTADGEAISTNNRNDILVFIHNKNMTKLQTGIASKLFNAQFFDLTTAVNPANIIACDKKIVIPTSDKVISVSNDDMIPETMIVVVNKNAFRHIWQVDISESQQWVENMTIQHVLHFWGAIGKIPWGQGFIYKNDNLPKTPTQVL